MSMARIGERRRTGSRVTAWGWITLLALVPGPVAAQQATVLTPFFEAGGEQVGAGLQAALAWQDVRPWVEVSWTDYLVYCVAPVRSRCDEPGGLRLGAGTEVWARWIHAGVGAGTQFGVDGGVWWEGYGGLHVGERRVRPRFDLRFRNQRHLGGSLVGRVGCDITLGRR